ncbi:MULTISPECIES: monovalent cation/H+ antiporter complex subunit F [Corynebacterium]|uniref:monovalent cation/H+ antiporter complex subunit F n=1 Tax=Corynebacterium TaxID=1716 RepID=UPI00124EDD54|nr:MULTISPECIES: monovalent cation/H+ antiporter complex subunit F [Corynebacterium]MBV7282625.1 cation:proton antiporter [Corynebacterium sp. TAE3-ERU30]MBV7302026.1 cation:proton antiporter [Corynebacterium sp. TAE3-ERU2]
MDNDLYTALLIIPSIMLSVSALIALGRILVGPNSLDRLLSFDAIVAMSQAALALYICYTLDTTVSNAMMVLALLGFISTVAVTRFRKRDARR